MQKEKSILENTEQSEIVEDGEDEQEKSSRD